VVVDTAEDKPLAHKKLILRVKHQQVVRVVYSEFVHRVAMAAHGA